MAKQTPCSKRGRYEADNTNNELIAVHVAELAMREQERSGVEGAMYARILALEAELAKKDAEIDAEIKRLNGLLTIYFKAQQETP